MRILLFGGTTEGRELAAALSERGHRVTVCVTTPLGAEELRGISGLRVRVGPATPEVLPGLLAEHDLCVDATHPYARSITKSLAAACRRTGTPLRRVLRPACGGGGAALVPDAAAAAAALRDTEGNILLTTGASALPAFRGLPPARLYARVLPTHEALAACADAGIPPRNILAMVGPFSVGMNLAILLQYEISYLVTKDGGPAGGYPEKLRAAALAGVPVITIARPDETGLSPEELLAELDALPGGEEAAPAETEL